MAFVLDGSDNLTECAWIGGTRYATIALAIAAASPGDHIILSEGIFSENLILNDNNLYLLK